MDVVTLFKKVKLTGKDKKLNSTGSNFIKLADNIL
jgi:hypothetical protein